MAELVRAAGHFIEVGPETTARQHETMLESQFMDFQLKKYSIQREPEDSPWSFIVSEPLDAEEALTISRMISNFEYVPS